jgi:hypothetical protein
LPSTRDIGLPAYLGFANKNMQAWFNREWRPVRRPSRLQAKIDRALRSPAPEGFAPDREADFTVYVQAEASPMHLYLSWHGGLHEPATLEAALCGSDRADLWAIDSGECFEAGFSDSAYADDRQFGYMLNEWFDTWGPTHAPFDDLSDDPTDDEFDAAELAYERQSSFCAGTAEVWVTDREAMFAYATVRHFLRTLAFREFKDVDDAARELFVRDLRDEPRGLRTFSALVTPIRR